MNGWLKQQNSSSTLLWVSCFWQSSGVHILHMLFLKSVIVYELDLFKSNYYLVTDLRKKYMKYMYTWWLSKAWISEQYTWVVLLFNPTIRYDYICMHVWMYILCLHSFLRYCLFIILNYIGHVIPYQATPI